MITMRRLLPLLVMTSTLISLGCARSAKRSADQDPEPAPGPTMLQVTNNNSSDVDVYIASGGERRRMGMVVGGDTQTFEIPPHLARRSGPISVVVRRIGGGGTYTASITLSPGQELDVNVAPVLNQSSIAVQRSVQ